MNPKMAKLMKILTAVVAAIIVFILVFTVGKATGLLKFNSKNVETTDNKKVETPNFEGKTLEEAKALAKKKGLTLEVVKEATSTKYEKGIVSKQMTGKGTSVKKAQRFKFGSAPDLRVRRLRFRMSAECLKMMQSRN